MRVINITEALNYDDGESIPSIKGIITKLWPQKSGTTKTGKEWTIQNGELADRNGNSMSFLLSNRQALEVKSWKGRECLIESSESKHGLSGIKVEWDDYKDCNVIKVTASATLSYAGGESGQPTDTPKAPKAPSASKSPNTSSAPPNQDGEETAKQFLNRAANLYLHAMLAARYVRRNYNSLKEPQEPPMSDQHFHGLSTTLFLEGSRNNLVHCMDIGEFGKKKAKKQDSPPESEPDPIPEMPLTPADDVPMSEFAPPEPKSEPNAQYAEEPWPWRKIKVPFGDNVGVELGQLSDEALASYHWNRSKFIDYPNFVEALEACGKEKLKS